MRTYQVLCALEPEAYLDPEQFRTSLDRNPEEHYQRGLKVSRESVTVGICANGTWFAHGIDGSSTTSYEGIGYHACTAEFLRGLLAGPAMFVVYRYEAASSPGHYGTAKIIKKADENHLAEIEYQRRCKEASDGFARARADYDCRGKRLPGR